jgi:hypothetical protein
MAKNSFRDLQTIYESYPMGNDPSDNLKYTPRLDIKNSYLTGINKPGTNMITSALPEAEEEKSIPFGPLKQKINALLADSEERGMGYCTSQLYELLKFIERT